MEKEKSSNSNRFSPREYTYSGRLPLDATFWAELSPEDKKGRFGNQGLLIPRSKLSRNWARTLRVVGVDPSITYDSRVVGLPNTVTREMIEREKQDRRKYVVENLNSSEPVQFEGEVTAESVIQSKKAQLAARLAARSFGIMRVDSKLTEFEQLLLQWHPGYGFLWDYSTNVGAIFPEPRDDSALKYEVVREFLFHIPPEKAEYPTNAKVTAENLGNDKILLRLLREKKGLEPKELSQLSPMEIFHSFEGFKFSDLASMSISVTEAIQSNTGIILSLAEEPNTNRAIWGFRRDLATDWPGNFIAPFVEKMNLLISGLEELLS